MQEQWLLNLLLFNTLAQYHKSFFFFSSKEQSIQWRELDEIWRGKAIKSILYAEEDLELAVILYSK